MGLLSTLTLLCFTTGCSLGASFVTTPCRTAAAAGGGGGGRGATTRAQATKGHDSRPKTWSNPTGADLVAVAENVWVVERPFIRNGIDIGSRATVIRLEDGALWVNEPVQLDERLKERLSTLGEVKYIVSPANNEHVRFVSDWISAFPNAKAFACPGVMEKRPDVPFHWSVGDARVGESGVPKDWPASIAFYHVVCEKKRLHPAFDEVVFFHRPSSCLMVTDLYWNYPSHDPLMAPQDRLYQLWMNRVYLPFYRTFLLTKKYKADVLMNVLTSWFADTVIPNHGRVIHGPLTTTSTPGDDKDDKSSSSGPTAGWKAVFNHLYGQEWMHDRIEEEGEASAGGARSDEEAAEAFFHKDDADALAAHTIIIPPGSSPPPILEK